MIKFILKHCNDIMFVSHFRSLLLLMLKSEGPLSFIILFNVTFTCVYSGACSHADRVINEHITCLYLNTHSRHAVWSIKVHWNHSIYDEWSYYFRSLETVVLPESLNTETVVPKSSNTEMVVPNSSNTNMVRETSDTNMIPKALSNGMKQSASRGKSRGKITRKYVF